MLPKEVLRKIRRIEITTSRLVTDFLSGQYGSVFKGRGIEFDEVREYQPGDEIRTIDWNVTARMGHPYVKKYVEERQLTVMLLLDASGSSHFGTTKRFKKELAAEVSAVLAFAAIKNNDRVGLIIFTDRIEKFVPPRKGLHHVLRVVREALYFNPKGRGTDIAEALRYLDNVISRRAIAFVISDFFAEDFKKSLSIANKKHDVVAITITDPRESELPNAGIIELVDAETGKRHMIDTSSAKIRETYAQTAREIREERAKVFGSVGVDHIDISTDRAYIDEFIKFFRMRKRRM
ncbi:MAG: hypothetical protein A3I73_00600 [Omnitrophica bacterium RIFCSPLOWO2_02_FULL_45_16]|nr:MAG: hypothetical protein A3C51_05025 [Omnitrophica bacterium RIFCSPHIGHO2_02_FULL_46_20]OGW94729.1 MAG: hypothetical protein A3G36_04810 [Omnitrophica bacterium RIFCSPLOWO2_12_FULL_45_13]OGW94895.1 MAG: hypothetical protein A3K16_03085 [Omnitrophica bacterium RIFCSPLOWO2_01_FULL_45_24]OGX01171.1 MAG: hypothetical protein A3I73_00600 [Omnitrophica bacterium RIFCSPLOWO2_02_FULL_45_16]